MENLLKRRSEDMFKHVKDNLMLDDGGIIL